MARKLRVQYPGAVYHVMNRGDRREPIYADDQDRLLFLDTLAEACEKTDCQVHAFAQDLQGCLRVPRRRFESPRV
jgi:putative transposase